MINDQGNIVKVAKLEGCTRKLLEEFAVHYWAEVVDAKADTLRSHTFRVSEHCSSI